MAAVLIVAHAPLASALKAVAGHVYADCGHAVLAIDVPADATPEQVREQARALMARGDEPDWLVLTDVFGATPCNAALMLADPGHVRVVTGVNVPMLWRTLCYADESLDALVTRAVGGATHGVMHLAPTRPQNQSPTTLPARDPVHRHHQQ
jgi:PTS system ascorbate-specific IIA component